MGQTLLLDDRDKAFLKSVGIEVVEADDLKWQKIKRFYRECGMTTKGKDWLIYEGIIFVKSNLRSVENGPVGGDGI